MYGEHIAPSGPVPRSARSDGTNVVVTFGDVADRLIAYSADGPIGFELCAAQRRLVPLRRRRGSTAIVWCSTQRESAAATRVRYCWADSPVCTLFDTAPLPAGPFQIEVQP